jgi:hypothetical protein
VIFSVYSKYCKLIYYIAISKKNKQNFIHINILKAIAIKSYFDIELSNLLKSKAEQTKMISSTAEDKVVEDIE